MGAEYIRQEVLDQLSKWTLIQDCLSGEPKVKSKGVVYLPMPNASDQSDENKQRYRAYLARAVFYNVTRRTLDGLVGQVFMRDPVLKISDKLSFISKDADGSGVSLDQQSKKALSETVSFGRCGLLVDYPPTTGTATVKDMEEGFIRPTISLYEPWDIPNWRTITVGAKEMLSLVVLRELYEQEDDGFEVKKNTQYRVLRLHYEVNEQKKVLPESLEYRVTIYREGQSSGKWDDSVEEYIPLDAKGRPFKEIPFLFIGSLNDDAIIDEPPLYDLASLNIAHYRNSADFEESSFLTGQPTPWMSGLTEQWVKEVIGGKVMLGARSCLPLPEGGAAGLLQAEPNTLPSEAMKHKERQMVALGGKLVEQREVQRTLGETQLENTSENSILTTCARNVSQAYNRALSWCYVFAGENISDEEPRYDLNTDFPAARMTTEERAELVAEWQAGAISYEEMRDQLRKTGVATRDDEAVKDAAESDTLRIGPAVGGDPGNSLTGGANNGRKVPKQNGKVT